MASVFAVYFHTPVPKAPSAVFVSFGEALHHPKGMIDMFQVKEPSQNSRTVSWRCDHCGDTRWPLLRIAGYPGPGSWELVEEGRAVLKGCMIEPGKDDEGYECPGCEKGVEIPKEYQDEDLASF